MRRSSRLLFILWCCGAVEWNSPQNLPESCLSYKILPFGAFFKSGIAVFSLFFEKMPFPRHRTAGGGTGTRI